MARLDDKADGLVVEEGQLGGRNPAQEARDENQPQPRRNIDGAQGGTVDCTETTEPKKKRKRKRTGGDKRRIQAKKKRSQSK